MSLLKSFISIVNILNDWVGRVISMLVFPMVGFLVWEVMMRYVFNQPTIWAHELSAILYAIFFLLGGAYTLQQKGHINVDILYLRLSPRKRASGRWRLTRWRRKPLPPQPPPGDDFP